LVTDELLAAFQIGQVIGRYTFEVTEDRIRRFAGVLDDIDLEGVATHREPPNDRQAAPTTFFATLDPLELKIMSHDHGLDLIPYRPTGGGNAFNEIHYVRPIRAGDVITVEVAYTDVYQRSGRDGPLVFRVRENTLTDATGERVAVARSGHVYTFDVSGYEPPDRSTFPSPAADDDQTGEELPALVRVPTTATLVRYAAAADDYAALHYDQTYARSRGYDGVIVHGFLKAGYMATMLEDWAGPTAFVERFRAEYRGPDYPDRKIICRGRVIRSFEEDGKRAADLALWTEQADGLITTRGSATVVWSDQN
jgi:acyl dehydratase